MTLVQSISIQKFQIQNVLKLAGCKPLDSARLAIELFLKMGGDSKKPTIECQRSVFVESASQLVLTKLHHLPSPERLHSRIAAATEVVLHLSSFTLFVGGTSGCGKSTVASVLGQRLGIDHIISTDSIRHILRTCSDPDDPSNSALWVSTYEAGQCIPAN
ncbi:MAG: hypothetical protein EZS28_041196, partial [Streblomastix strix]